MTQSRARSAVAAAAALLFAVWIASCSSSSTTSTGDDTPALPTATRKVATTGTAPPEQCTNESITRSAEAKYPESKLEDLGVTLSFGIATIFPKEGPKKGVVGFFSASTEGCALVAEADPAGDVQAAAPPEFPKSLIDEWKRRYADPTATTTSTRAPTTTTGEGCVNEGDAVKCPSTTTTAKPTTTTRQTTTTSRPTTTTGPPQTIIIR